MAGLDTADCGRRDGLSDLGRIALGARVERKHARHAGIYIYIYVCVFIENRKKNEKKKNNSEKGENKKEKKVTQREKKLYAQRILTQH